MRSRPISLHPITDSPIITKVMKLLRIKNIRLNNQQSTIYQNDIS